jgi:putative acetyltransferase
VVRAVAHLRNGIVMDYTHFNQRTTESNQVIVGVQRNSSMIIRPETPSDHDSIRQILIAAFADHPYSHQTEHLIIEGLRADGALTVSLVAEVDGKVVGQIAFSPVKIDEKDCRWLGLGPVAVTPSLQRQGIGQALVNGGLKTIRDLGAQGCILVGDPAFYRRFGFENNPALRMEGVPPEVLMCLPMSDKMLEGNVTHHPAFFVGE